MTDMIKTMIEKSLHDKRVVAVNNFCVVTDQLDYSELNQVLPLFPEQQFFLDEIVPEKIRGAKGLEIGVGSGVLSIGAVKAGAEKITALEINPRAKNFAGFNILLNGAEGRIEIMDGDDDIFKPVQGRQFDYIFSNPPFDPTPPGAEHYLHSAAGAYGLDFIEKIFKDLDEYLTDEGHGQIVTAAPGNDNEPFLLLDLVKKYLPGAATVVVNPVPIEFEHATDFLEDRGLATVEQTEALKQSVRKQGISHSHLCVIHYEKGTKALKVEPSKTIYHDWNLPL
ncbi:MAG: class I SAM-dependent methyltransferase [Desulfobacteraceae bacterium]|nr:class I SAM-dependent methyltransferase [Desulfobacteraceae bacterium]